MKRFAIATALTTAAAAPALADFHFQAQAEPDGEQTYTYNVNADGRMTVIIDGDNSTDLDLFVYNEHGELIGQDLNYSDRGEVTFYAEQGDQIRVRVTNLGGRYNDYQVAYETPDMRPIDDLEFGRVRGGYTASYDFIPTRSGWVRTSVIADEDNDLDLFVYDENHELLDYDVRYDSDGHVEFRVTAHRTYSIEVQNASSRRTGFRLVTRED